MYIHELKNWPNFVWDSETVLRHLAAVRHEQGRLMGRMEGLGFQGRQEAALATLSADVIKSSEIEGERLDAGQVRSSIARRLGLDVGGLPVVDRRVEGVVEMMLDASRGYAQTLTEERLFSWHTALFPAGRSGLSRIRVGAWRDDRMGPMQVVSGAVGREKVHFVAPAASRLSGEMISFLKWFNEDGEMDLILKAGLAHIWFVTLHPFDDGNGRVARAVADMLLARSEGSPQRFYSLSAQIMRERASYYEILETNQKGTMDVTSWMDWFLACLDRAIQGADTTLGAVLAKARFWKAMEGVPLNERQRKGLLRLLEGLQGKLTTSKWAKLVNTSQDTALRDILDLVAKGALVKGSEGGRSTNYILSQK